MTEAHADRPHSDLGASGAERWMNCVGSTRLIRALKMDETDEPEYRQAGTAAHEALAKCMTESLDAWEVVGETFNGVEVDDVMADAIQEFINIARPLAQSARKTYIEFPMAHPDFHEKFFGTVDFGAQHGIAGRKLTVLDFKYGEGIPVEVEGNPQPRYYAFGILLLHPEIEEVELGIVQPRIPWHPDGIHRTDTMTADELRAWATDELRPAMEAADGGGPLLPGDWCRFCPAKLICPVLTHLFEAAAKADPKEIVTFDDAAIDRNYPLIDGVKHYIRALEAETFNRLNSGHVLDNAKLVKKKANRVWKPEANALFTSRFGDKAMTTPELKSPAEMEKINPDAKELVHEFAYTPDSGLTVALRSDRRAEVKVKSLAETFAGAVNKGEVE